MLQFTGNWHDTMYQAVEATTEGAQLWFTAYVFVLAVFCCELFVGVVIAGYSELQCISSPRMHWVFAPVFEECKHEERNSLIEELLKLAHKMRPCNQLHATILRHIRESAGFEGTSVVNRKIEPAPDPQAVAINLNQARASSSSAEGAAPELVELPNMVSRSKLKPIQKSEYRKVSSKRRSSIVKFKLEAELKPANLESAVQQSPSALHAPKIQSIFKRQLSRRSSHSDVQYAAPEPKWQPTARDEVLLDDDMPMAEDNLPMDDSHLHDMVTDVVLPPLREPLPVSPKTKPKRLKTREEKQARNEVSRMAKEEAAKSRVSEEVLARRKSKHIAVHSLVSGSSMCEDTPKKTNDTKTACKASK